MLYGRDQDYPPNCLDFLSLPLSRNAPKLTVVPWALLGSSLRLHPPALVHQAQRSETQPHRRLPSASLACLMRTNWLWVVVVETILMLLMLCGHRRWILRTLRHAIAGEIALILDSTLPLLNVCTI